ncbi:hypothetical protein [Cesiribacter sp. SM1]|uniref:hypothetical protein n=1 Tax=Cesiribacter sp. SM1 TaxID=2861196 RepID=UPI001CD49105|nr:hypothetical protein [Cesiribacter sp. SM1]
MPNQHIRELYQHYQDVRQISLSVDQFTSFLAFFPALLIAASDGIVDREEWLYCQRLAEGLGYSYREELSTEEANRLTLLYRQEFAYLLKHLSSWEEPFLNTLEKYFLENHYAKKFVSQTAWLFADASNGVSAEEESKMTYLRNRFGLSKEDMSPFDELR